MAQQMNGPNRAQQMDGPNGPGPNRAQQMGGPNKARGPTGAQQMNPLVWAQQGPGPNRALQMNGPGARTQQGPMNPLGHAILVFVLYTNVIRNCMGNVTCS